MGRTTRLSSRWSPLLFPAVLAFGCGDRAAGHAGAPRAASLSDVFPIQDTVTLEEAAGDSIGDIRTALELSNGDLVVVERYRPRIHHYDARGRLLVSFGRVGEGPGELRSIHGVAEDSTGSLHLIDSELGRITVVSSATLEYERVETPPFQPWGLLFHGSDMLAWGIAGRRTDRLCYIDSAGAIEWSAFPYPEYVHQQPYWINFADLLVAVISERIVAGNGITYPFVVFDLRGDSVGTFGSPPPSFRRIPSVRPGALSAGGPAYERFLASFTVARGIYPVGSDRLAVVHSYMEPHPIAGMLSHDYALDVYSWPDGAKLLEDVPLPDGARVLTGGRHLYIIVAQPPAPWTIVRLSRVRESAGSGSG